MSTRPTAALNESAAKQIIAEKQRWVPPRRLAAALAVDLANEILARGGWKANTCAPLLRAYQIVKTQG